MAETFLTFEDIVNDGACASGVLEACAQTGVYFGPLETVLKAFTDEQPRIMRAAKKDGYGYGYGDGDGDGDGYGDGDGDGDGGVI